MSIGARPPSRAPFALYCCLTAVFGVLNAVTGLVLPEFERQAGLDSAGIADVLFYRGVGSMAGGVAVGALLDSGRDPHRVLAALLLLKAAAELTMPYGASLAALCAQFFVVAFCAIAVTTLSITLTGWTYGKHMGTQQNLMSAVFGIGASCAPMLATFVRRNYSRAVFSYWSIAGLDILLMAAALAIPAVQNPRRARSADERAQELNSLLRCQADQDQERGEKELKSATADHVVDWIAVVLCGASALFAGMIDAAIQCWLFTYMTDQLRLTAEAASTVTTAFFLAFTIVRFVCGGLVTVLGAAAILKAALVFSLAASLGIVFPQGWAALPVLGLSGIGVGLAPFVANIITVLGQKSFISGLAQGLISIMTSIGFLMGGSGVGFLMKWPLVGNAALPAVVLMGLVALTLVTAGVVRRCR